MKLIAIVIKKYIFGDCEFMDILPKIKAWQIYSTWDVGIAVYDPPLVVLSLFLFFWRNTEFYPGLKKMLNAS